MLRSGELAALRADAQAGMPETGLVERFDIGTGLWQTVGAYPCRVVPKRAVTKDSGGTLVGVTTWNIWLPWNADVRVNDRVRVGTALHTVTGCDVGRSEPVLVVVQCG